MDTLDSSSDAFDRITCDFDLGTFCEWFPGRWEQMSGVAPPKFSGPLAAPQGCCYAYVNSENNILQDVALTSPWFNISEEVAYVSFQFHMFSLFTDDMGTLQLQFWTSLGEWFPLWSKSGSQTGNWLRATVLVPGDASRLRFVGKIGPGPTSDMAIDDIVAYTGVAPSVDFVDCDFEYHLCGWTDASAHGSDWQRVSANANMFPKTADSGTSFVQLTRGGDKESVLLSPQFLGSQSERAFQFSYYMDGEGVGTLEVQHWNNSGAWYSLWERSGPQGSTWHHAVLFLPVDQQGGEGNAVRFVARAGSGGDIALDSIDAENMADLFYAGCSFEVDDYHYCGWSGPWMRNSANRITLNPGPALNLPPDFSTYWIFVTNHQGGNPDYGGRVFPLTSPFFRMPQLDQISIKFYYVYHTLGYDQGSLELQYWTVASGWLTLWMQAEGQGENWRLLTLVVPKETLRLRFIGTPGKLRVSSTIAIDDISIISGPTWSINVVDCDFEYHLCGWTDASAHGSDWQRVSANANMFPKTADSGTSFVQLTRGGDKESVLLSPKFLRDQYERAFQFSYYMDGEGVGTLEVQHWNNSGAWYSLWERSGPQGSTWHHAVLFLPVDQQGGEGNAVRFVARAGSGGDIALDSVETERHHLTYVASNIASLSCDFESECVWLTGSLWQRRSGASFLAAHGFPGPSASYQGEYYLHLRVWWNDALNYNKEFATTSPYFKLAEPFLLSFAYHMWGHSSMGTLELQIWVSPHGWLAVWSKSGNQGSNWLRATVLVPEDASRLRFVGNIGPGWASDMGIDDIVAHTRVAPSVDFVDCDFEYHLCGWTDASAHGSDWQRVSANANMFPKTADSGTSFVQLTRGGDKESVLLSPQFLGSQSERASERAFQFSYYMDGEGVGTLEVQHWNNSGAWDSLWERSGPQGSTWHHAVLFLPADLTLSPNPPLCISASCSSITILEEDGGQYRISRGMEGYHNNEDTTISVQGPGSIAIIAFGTEYHWDTLTIDGTSFSGSSVALNTAIELTAGQKEIVWKSDISVTSKGWTLTFQPQIDTSERVRFLHTEMHGSAAFVALDSIEAGVVVSSTEAIHCDFQARGSIPDFCHWSPDRQGIWEVANNNEGRSRGIRSHLSIYANSTTITSPFLKPSEAKYMSFAYLFLMPYNRSDQSTSVHLQFLTESDNWFPLWGKTGSQGVFWLQDTVSIPNNAVRLRWVFGLGDNTLDRDYELIGIANISSVPYFLSPNVVSCNFETDECGWSPSASWQRILASSLQLVHSPAETSYMYASANDTTQHILQSTSFLPLSSLKVLHFGYWVTGTGHLELQCFNSEWAQLWKADHEHLQWQHRIVEVPALTTALRFIFIAGDQSGEVAVDAIAAFNMASDLESLQCDFDAQCQWTSVSHPWQRTYSWSSSLRGNYMLWSNISSSLDNELLIMSPFFEASSEMYFTFAYNTFGNDEGRLELQCWTQRNGWSRLWNHTFASRSSKWVDTAVVTPEMSKVLRFIGYAGNSSIAVDSFTILPLVNDTASLDALGCNFERDMCLWSEGSDFRLTRHSGAACSFCQLGGAADGHFYVQIDSNDSLDGPKFVLTVELFDGTRHHRSVETMFTPEDVVLVSPMVRETALQTYFSFAYHMFQDSSSSLQLQLQAWLRQSWTVIWSRSGQQGPTWRHAKVPLPDKSEGLRFVASGEYLGLDDFAAYTAGQTVFASLAGGGNFACILYYSNGQVRCFGGNSNGQLGQGHQSNIGDEPGEMGGNLPAIDLGEGMFAKEVACGSRHTCVLLQDGSVKCFGGNRLGSLGLGHTFDISDPSNSSVVDLGHGLFAIQISAGFYHTCALLQDNTVKCFGNNGDGQLGQGHTRNLGDEPGEMGDDLPPIDLGHGLLADFIAAGGSHTCVLLHDASVKCFGGHYRGELGHLQGFIPYQTQSFGDNLLRAELGTDKIALQIAGGNSFTCFLLQDNSVKCFGANRFGQLGQGHAKDTGDGVNVGDNLQPIDFGDGLFAIQISAGIYHTCALLQDSSIKCFGGNRQGQLGQGHTRNLGDEPGEMGDNLPPIDFGESALAVQVVAFGDSTCVLFEDDSVKCFGRNTGGTLGQGHQSAIGAESCEIQGLAPLELPPLTPAEMGSLRLRGTPGSDGDDLRGRVEVFYNDSWGTICDDGWSDFNAQAACSKRQV